MVFKSLLFNFTKHKVCIRLRRVFTDVLRTQKHATSWTHQLSVRDVEANDMVGVRDIGTVEPCTLAQSDHLWGLVVTKPVILSKKGINMTWCRYNGLQYIQRSAF